MARGEANGEGLSPSANAAVCKGDGLGACSTAEAEGNAPELMASLLFLSLLLESETMTKNHLNLT